MCLQSACNPKTNLPSRQRVPMPSRLGVDLASRPRICLLPLPVVCLASRPHVFLSSRPHVCLPSRSPAYMHLPSVHMPIPSCLVAQTYPAYLARRHHGYKLMYTSAIPTIKCKCNVQTQAHYTACNISASGATS